MLEPMLSLMTHFNIPNQLLKEAYTLGKSPLGADLSTYLAVQQDRSVSWPKLLAHYCFTAQARSKVKPASTQRYIQLILLSESLSGSEFSPLTPTPGQFFFNVSELMPPPPLPNNCLSGNNNNRSCLCSWVKRSKVRVKYPAPHTTQKGSTKAC